MAEVIRKFVRKREYLAREIKCYFVYKGKGGLIDGRKLINLSSSVLGD